jgi:DNA-binding beta-propeller fold protein YncE
VNLPEAFGAGPAGAKTLAVSVDGTRLYAIDTDRSLLTELRTRGPRVETTAQVDFGPQGDGTAVAATAPDGTLYVGWNGSIVAIDGQALTVGERWDVEGQVTGLALGADGTRLYVAFGDRIMALDPSTGDQLATIPTPGVQGISFVGSAA